MIALEELSLDCEPDVVFLYQTRRDPGVANMLLGEPPHDLETHKKWLSSQHLKRRILFVIKLHGENVGYCQMSLSGTPVTELGWVIAPEFQGQGHGGRAVRLLAEEAAKKGFMEAELFVKQANAGAIKIYLARGFVAVGEKDGVLHMIKRLHN